MKDFNLRDYVRIKDSNKVGVITNIDKNGLYKVEFSTEVGDYVWCEPEYMSEIVGENVHLYCDEVIPKDIPKEKWQQLKETIAEIKDNNEFEKDDVTVLCTFLLNYMGVLENENSD